jgi:hypothetical protein
VGPGVSPSPGRWIARSTSQVLPKFFNAEDAEIAEDFTKQRTMYGLVDW